MIPIGQECQLLLLFLHFTTRYLVCSYNHHICQNLLAIHGLGLLAGL
jgi:hypothetical protein